MCVNLCVYVVFAAFTGEIKIYIETAIRFSTSLIFIRQMEYSRNVVALPPPPYIFLCVYVNSNSISLDNSRFTHQYENSCFNTIAEFLQFILLLLLANINIVDNIHLGIAALLLACI